MTCPNAWCYATDGGCRSEKTFRSLGEVKTGYSNDISNVHWAPKKVSPCGPRCSSDYIAEECGAEAWTRGRHGQKMVKCSTILPVTSWRSWRTTFFAESRKMASVVLASSSKQWHSALISRAIFYGSRVREFLPLIMLEGPCRALTWRD